MLHGTLVPGFRKLQSHAQLEPSAEHETHVAINSWDLCVLSPTPGNRSAVKRTAGHLKTAGSSFAYLQDWSVTSTTFSLGPCSLLNPFNQLVHDYTRFCLRMLRS